MASTPYEVEAASVSAFSTPSFDRSLSANRSQVREVVMNGSRILMRHDGRSWWNVRVIAL